MNFSRRCFPNIAKHQTATKMCRVTLCDFIISSAGTEGHQRRHEILALILDFGISRGGGDAIGPLSVSGEPA
ncbi:MAG: hypothetical protein KBF27_02510 [Cypionkella sp.]|nr:hypothetical protein [Cypionkella sp.]